MHERAHEQAENQNRQVELDNQEGISRDIWDGMKGGKPGIGGGEGGTEPGLKTLPKCTIEVSPDEVKVTCDNGKKLQPLTPELPFNLPADFLTPAQQSQAKH